MAIDKNSVMSEARKFVAKGQYDKAIAEWQKLLRESPNDANIYNTIGDLCLKKNSRNEAVDSYKLAADILAGDGFTSKAIALYKKILNIDSTRIDAHLALGDMNAQKGLIGNAVENYKYAADYYTRNNRSAEALGIYQKMADLNPSNTAFRIKLADMYAREGMAAEAAGEYLAAADAHAAKDEFKEARHLFEKLLAIDPANKAVYHKAGLVYLREGKYAEACKALKSAFENDPANSDVADAYLEALSMAGKEEDAQQLIGRILARDPGRLDLRERLKPSLAEKKPETPSEENPAVPVPAAAQEQAPEPPRDVPQPAPAEPGGEEQIDPALAEAFSEIDVLVKYGLADKALAHLEELAKKFPESIHVRTKLSDLYRDKGEKEEAIPEPVALSSLEETATLEVTPDAPAASEIEESPPTLEEAERAEEPASASMEELTFEAPDAGMPVQDEEAPSTETAEPVSTGPGDSFFIEEEELVSEPPPSEEQEDSAFIEEEVPVPEAPSSEEQQDSAFIEEEAPVSEPPPSEEQQDSAFIEEEVPVLEPPPSEEQEDNAFIEEEAMVPEPPPSVEQPEALQMPEEPGGDAAPDRGEEAFEPAAGNYLEDALAEAEFYYQQGLFKEAKKLYARIIQLNPAEERASEKLAELAREEDDSREFEKLTEAVEGLEGALSSGPAEQELPLSESDEDAVRGLMKEIAQLEYLSKEPEPSDIAQGSYGEAAEPETPEAGEDLFDLAAELAAESVAESGVAEARSEDYFDLASELSDELGGIEAPARPADNEEQSLDEIFEEFKRGVEKQSALEDVDARYNLGVAYKEMGLLDDAIEEFTRTPGDAPKYAQSRYMLGLCYLEKGAYHRAIDELQNALDSSEALGDDEKGRIGMRYDLGLACQGAGDLRRAFAEFQKVFGTDPLYQDVSAKLEELAQGDFVSFDQLRDEIEKEISEKFLVEGERIEREEKSRKNDEARH